jgi:hypothetical protein
VLKEEGADKMLNLFDGESDTPELIWESSMRTELRRVVGQLLDACIEERRRAGVGNESYVLDPSTRVKYQRLDDELFIGGVYVSRFLKEPTYNIRDPTRFLEMLMQRWSHELQSCTQNDHPVAESQSTALMAAGSDTLQSITNASVYICKIRTNLCDKLSNWGYMGRCLSFLDEVLTKELYGTPLLSVMRILHVSVNCRSNVENLILSGKNDRSNGIIPFTMRAIEAEDLHKDVAFMLEMMKKLFADALGDVKSANSGVDRMQHGAHAMAPSPAPGEGPVSRNRVSRGNPMDDPLAMPSSFDPPAVAANGGLSQNPMQSPLPTMTTQPMTSFQTQQQMSNSYGQGNPNQSSNMSYSQQSFSDPAGNMYGVRGAQGQPQGYQYSNTAQSQYQHQGYGGQMQPPQPPAPSFQQQPQFSSTSYQPQNAQSQSWNQPLGYSPAAAGPSNVVNPSQTQQQPSAYGRPTVTPSMQQQQQQQQPYMQQQQQRQPQQYSQQQPQQQQPQQYSQQQPQQQQQQQYIPQQRQQQQTFQERSKQQGLQNYPESTNMGAPVPQRLQEQQPQQYGQQPFPTQSRPPAPQQPTFDHNSVSAQVPSGNNAMGGSAMNQGSHYQDHPVSSAGLVTGSPQQFVQTPVSGNDQGGTMPVSQGVIPPGTMPVMPHAIPQNMQPGTIQSSQRTDGTGVDARVTLSPTEEAERRMKTVAGGRGSADGRKALLQSVILCDFPNFIVDTVLENPKLQQVKDPAAAKVHGVELLKLLSQDPGYGMKFRQILDENPKWKKYKTQDHSLFITGPEQRADYFLTDGGNGEAKKLLTQG